LSDINQKKCGFPFHQFIINDVVNLGNTLNKCSKFCIEIIQFTSTTRASNIVNRSLPFNWNHTEIMTWRMDIEVCDTTKYPHPLLYYIVLPICSFKLAHYNFIKMFEHIFHWPSPKYFKKLVVESSFFHVTSCPNKQLQFRKNTHCSALHEDWDRSKMYAVVSHVLINWTCCTLAN